MMINYGVHARRAFPVRSLALCSAAAALLSLAACAAPPPPRPVPVAPVAPPPRSAPVASPAASPPVDWRDATPLAGTWRYQARSMGGTARFIASSGSPLLSLRCDRDARTVTIAREGLASLPQPTATETATVVPALISASTQQRRLTASQVATELLITVPAQDTLLDALAFSRGRFAIDIYGTPMLVLPAWSEVARVVEDCR